ncbi:hypothetical protein GN958_ATG18682 [Phytophthora infestans]|uniref:Uncharacterized protein n=1 Tax=Phytophthora infestans TaxID=4787 RepID=A0A8S9TTE6_PHYIN|nr:hypothetical protein GN958_ATG18682 [Phytophthora infestans]
MRRLIKSKFDIYLDSGTDERVQRDLSYDDKSFKPLELKAYDSDFMNENKEYTAFFYPLHRPPGLDGTFKARRSM